MVTIQLATRPFTCLVLVLSVFQSISCWQPPSSSAKTSLPPQPPPQPQHLQSRSDSLRTLFLLSTSTFPFFFFPPPSLARAPGSTDLSEAVAQIRDAAGALRQLQRDWPVYAVVDGEGRAGNTDPARRILGGIAPQAGTAAIEAAERTPLYRIDRAFGVVRDAAIDAEEGRGLGQLDLVRYNELVEEVLFALQKADGDCYSVLFAAKGTKQISGIFNEAKAQVDQGVKDIEEIVSLLEEAQATKQP